MKAAQLPEYGNPDLIKLVDNAPKPEPAADQVLIEVHAAGINPFDGKVAHGDVREMVELKFPAILGGDVAGTVAALGENVTNLEIGQAVYGQANALSSHGSFAEFTVAKASALSSKPESVDFLTAAPLPLAAVSAYQALVDIMQLQSGQKVLIHGGAGGIGSLAIQIAKHYGAYVITTASEADIDYVKQLGADQAINYKIEDFATVLSDLDAVFDTVGGETNKKSYGVLRDGGALVSMVEEGDSAEITLKHLEYQHMFTRVTTERLTAIAAMVDAGQLTVNIDKVFPLAETGQAIGYLQTGHPRGKVVIQVA